jgi:hypothetical protein
MYGFIVWVWHDSEKFLGGIDVSNIPYKWDRGEIIRSGRRTSESGLYKKVIERRMKKK